MTVAVNGAHALVRADERLPAQLTGRVDEWEALSPSDRRLLVPEVVERWTSHLLDEDYSLAELATFERRRRSALATLRAESELSETEWKLMRYLQRNEGRNVSYLRIARHLWSTAANPITPARLRQQMDMGRPYYAAPMIAAIQNLVYQLRKKLEIDPLRPQHLATIRGVGYRWYSAPPSLDDGENYQKRALEIERDRAEMQAVLGITEGEFTIVQAQDQDGQPYETRVWFGPEHPDAQPPRERLEPPSAD